MVGGYTNIASHLMYYMHGQSIKSWRLLFKMKLPHLKVNSISYTTCKIILLISINETQLVEEMSDVDSLLLFDHWKSDIFIVQWIILVIFAPLSTVTSTYLRRQISTIQCFFVWNFLCFLSKKCQHWSIMFTLGQNQTLKWVHTPSLHRNFSTRFRFDISAQVLLIV